jgi:hypothetical protein
VAAGQAIQHRERPGNLHSLVAHAFDRRDQRPPGRHHVLDDEHPFTRLDRRTLDPALESVLLALLANDERPEVVGRGENRAGHGIGPQRGPAYRHGPQASRFAGNQLSCGAKRRRAQQGPARIDVVLGGAAAGQRHLTDHEAVLPQPRQEYFAGAR